MTVKETCLLIYFQLEEKLQELASAKSSLATVRSQMEEERSQWMMERARLMENSGSRVDNNTDVSTYDVINERMNE